MSADRIIVVASALLRLSGLIPIAVVLSGCTRSSYPGEIAEITEHLGTKDSFATAHTAAGDLRRNATRFSSSDPNIKIRNVTFYVPDVNPNVMMRVEYEVSPSATLGEHSAVVSASDVRGTVLASTDVKIRVVASKARAQAMNGTIMLLIGALCLAIGVGGLRGDEPPGAGLAGAVLLLLAIGGGLAIVYGIWRIISAPFG